MGQRECVTNFSYDDYLWIPPPVLSTESSSTMVFLRKMMVSVLLSSTLILPGRLREVRSLAQGEVVAKAGCKPGSLTLSP